MKRAPTPASTLERGDIRMNWPVGTRVRSISNGFTRGLVGTIEEFGRGGDPEEPVAFVKFDEHAISFAVAIRLLVREDAPRLDVQ